MLLRQFYRVLKTIGLSTKKTRRLGLRLNKRNKKKIASKIRKRCADKCRTARYVTATEARCPFCYQVCLDIKSVRTVIDADFALSARFYGATTNSNWVPKTQPSGLYKKSFRT